MQRWILGVFLVLGACKPATPGATGDAAAATTTGGTLRTDDERTLYALGMVMGTRMAPFNLTAPELAVVQRGIAAQVTGSTPEVNLQEWGPRIDQMARTRGEARATQVGCTDGSGGPAPSGCASSDAGHDRPRGRRW